MPSALEIEGTVFRRGDDTFEEIRRRTFANSAWDRDGSTPLLIAEVAGTSDVQKCLRWAAAEKVKVSVRSGGHNWFGSFLQHDTLLIDMRRLETITIDPASHTATVGPSALGQKLNETASEHGLYFSSGHCPQVPVGGFLLGGGLGWFHDHFGLAAESIVGFTVVAPSGEVIEASPETEPDWMWLARGAGAAFPGVAVSFTIKLHRLPSIIRNRISLHPLEDYAAIVKFIQRQRLNGSISSKVDLGAVLVCTPPPLADAIQDPKICMVSLSMMADSEEEFDVHMKAVKDIPSAPLLPYEEPQDHTLSSLPELFRGAYPEGLKWMVTSYLLENTNDEVDWDGIRASFEHKAPMGLPSVLTVVGLWREAPKERAGAYGPVPFPGILLGTYGVYKELSEVPALVDFERSTVATVEHHSVKNNVLEHQLNQETYSKIFVGSNNEKLDKLRKVVDPNGLFFDPAKSLKWLPHISQ